jgi:hypothetical protein
MNNNSDGLSPSLRPLLGVGWNRALPAPFGFDRGIFGDGVNDYLHIPLNRLALPTSFAVEFWYNADATTTQKGLLLMNDDINALKTRVDLRFNANALFGIDNGNGSGQTFNVNANAYNTGRHYCLINFNSLLSQSFLVDIYVDNYPVSSGTASIPGAFATILDSISLLRGRAGYLSYGLDEFRIYSKTLTVAQKLLNYNDAVGNNPCETEFLMMWYKFQEFEMLDFSIAQDGSDIRLGIRDLSGRNRHAQAMNMDTNPASPNYVLKPF